MPAVTLAATRPVVLSSTSLAVLVTGAVVRGAVVRGAAADSAVLAVVKVAVSDACWVSGC